jgi:hypothetical protein
MKTINFVKMTRIIIGLSVLSLAAKADSKVGLGPSATEKIVQNGSLVSITLEMGEPIKIFVVGREEAKLDLKRLKLTVRRLSPLPVESVATQFNGSYFSFVEAFRATDSIKLEVKTRVQGKDETFQFDVKNRSH